MLLARNATAARSLPQLVVVRVVAVRGAALGLPPQRARRDRPRRRRRRRRCCAVAVEVRGASAPPLATGRSHAGVPAPPCSTTPHPASRGPSCTRVRLANLTTQKRRGRDERNPSASASWTIHH
eukprot:scaffold1056_cov564-Prasinococcus_capsulatus_cf.AAC.9